MQKTVLITINTSWNIWHFRSSLIGELKSAGYRVVSVAPDDAFSPRLRSIVDAHHHIAMHGSGTSLWQEARLLLDYYRLLKTIRPDVVLAYTIKPNIYASLAARILSIPVINNVSGLGTAFIRNNWLTVLAKSLYRLAFRRSACVFFQNAEDQALFIKEQMVRQEQARLIPGSGIDLTFFHPQFNSPAVTENGQLRFVLIARLLWDKGIGEFVNAARSVKEKYPQTLFRIVGPGGVQNRTAIAEDVISGWVKEGVVEYMGESDDVRKVIAMHDCVVLPSYREGMSRVLLEAAAMGKPIITTNVPGCKHVVEHGINGLLCAAQDTHSLAQSLHAFIAMGPEAREKMGHKSREKAAREFDQRLVHQAYLKAISQMI